jgi:hypothetical protein
MPDGDELLSKFALFGLFTLSGINLAFLLPFPPNEKQ